MLSPTKLAYFLSLILISLSLMGFVSSQTHSEQDAEIIELYVSPEPPIIDQASEIMIKIKNIGGAGGTFKVKLYVLKGGNIKLEKNFEFKIEPNELWMDIEKFTPNSIGIHKIRAEIWDASKNRLLDAETIDVMVKGDIGPFDASIDVITTYPYPGKEVFAIINLLNKGIQTVDVAVNYEIEGTGILGKYMMAPEPESESPKVISMPAPSEPGLYNISVDVEYEDSIIASASGNFYLISKEYRPVLKLEGTPSIIELEQGQTEGFSIKVSNTGDSVVSDVHLIVRGISPKWVEVWPSSLDLIPEQSTLYLANFKIPEEADIESYTFEFIAVGKEDYATEPSSLIVLASGLDGVREDMLGTSINQILNIIGPIVGITLLIIIFFVGRRKKIVFPKMRKPEEIIKKGIPLSIKGLAFLDLHNAWRADGLVIGLDFIDAEGKTLSFKDVKMNVTVSLFTIKTDPRTLMKEKGRIVHRGTVTVENNSDLNIPAGKGVLIPKEEINVDPRRDAQYGILEITVRTPEGRGFFAKDEFVKLY